MQRKRTLISCLAAACVVLASLPAAAAFDRHRAHPAEQRLLHASETGREAGRALGRPVDRMRARAPRAEVRGLIAPRGPEAPVPEPSGLLVFGFAALAVVGPAIRRHRRALAGAPTVSHL